eukprot:1136842-Pelagomonas_calceolata.AAC.2
MAGDFQVRSQGIRAAKRTQYALGHGFFHVGVRRTKSGRRKGRNIVFAVSLRGTVKSTAKATLGWQSASSVLLGTASST